MRRALRLLWLCWLMLACFAVTARAQDVAGIHVCVRPPGAESANVWAYAPSGATVVGMKREDFKKASAGPTTSWRGAWRRSGGSETRTRCRRWS